MKRISLTMTALAAVLFTFAASAGQTKIFGKYENVRQALLSESVDDVQATGKELADTARAEKQNVIAERATALATVSTLKGARDSFAMLSDELIRFRDSRSGTRPVVVYCSMEKKSWLQAKGAVTNPYVDASMRSCGVVRKDNAAPAFSTGPGNHH